MLCTPLTSANVLSNMVMNALCQLCQGLDEMQSRIEWMTNSSKVWLYCQISCFFTCRICSDTWDLCEPKVISIGCQRTQHGILVYKRSISSWVCLRTFITVVMTWKIVLFDLPSTIMIAYVSTGLFCGSHIITEEAPCHRALASKKTVARTFFSALFWYRLCSLESILAHVVLCGTWPWCGENNEPFN